MRPGQENVMARRTAVSPAHRTRGSVRGARSTGGPPVAGALLALQRQAGNAAVASAMGALAVQRAGGKHRPTAECPGYGPGEIKKSRSDNGVLISDVTELPSALRIADFAVNSSTVRESAKKDPLVRGWFAAFESNTTLQLDVLGLDDCVGPTAGREKLRGKRAQNVLALLGPSAQSRVRFAGAAPPDQFTADDRTEVGRARNRGVLIQFNQTLDMKDTTVTGKRPKSNRPMHECDDKQEEALHRAHPMAVDMAERALAALAPYPHPKLTGIDREVFTNQVEVLLKKYFNDASDRTRRAVKDGFVRTIRGLKVTGFVAEDFQCG